MIFKSRLIGKFTQVPNKLAQNKNLSIEALGLMTYLLSLPDDWAVNKEHLRSHFKMGKARINKIMNELISAGYIIDVPQLNAEDGKFKRKDYVVYAEPFNGEGTEPMYRKPLTVNDTLQINKEQKNILQINKKTAVPFQDTVEIKNLFSLGYGESNVTDGLSETELEQLVYHIGGSHPDKVIELGKCFKEAGWVKGKPLNEYLDAAYINTVF